MSIERDLYGGAIVAKMPPNLIDASDIRQVPDNQEVFLYPDSGVSIIVEILQMVQPPQLEDAIKFHFDSLAHDNSAKTSAIENISAQISNGDKHTPAPVLLKGVQLIPKFNHLTLDKVRIFMGLFRVKSKNADLVVSFNVPIDTQDGNAVDVAGQETAEADFKTFVTSLSIVRFDLFA